METHTLIPKKRRKLSRLIKFPLKLLIKARDLYVAGMAGYSDRLGVVGVMGCPTGPVVNTLPKSYSLNSTRSSNYSDDYSELLRSASTKSAYGNRIQLDHLQRQKSTKNNKMSRSSSVGIGRIDEDKSCRFDGNVIKLDTDVVFTKSRSYVVGSTRTSNGVLKF